jgi:hypothetical protein
VQIPIPNRANRVSLTEERKATRMSLATIFSRTLFGRSNSSVVGDNPMVPASSSAETNRNSSSGAGAGRTSLTRTPSLTPGTTASASRAPSADQQRTTSVAKNPMHKGGGGQMFTIQSMFRRTATITETEGENSDL